MKNSSEASFQLLQDFHSTQIQPYQALIQTISLQNNIIQSLQQKHKQLKSQYSQLSKESNKDKSITEQMLEKRKKELKRQKELFLEQALTEKQQKYEQEFRSKKKMILEEIHLKYQQINLIRKESENRTNLFIHLTHELPGNKEMRKKQSDLKK